MYHNHRFWLRGHCLKGEGRCEFLHSVPPHLASDVAQLRAHAIRSRENEKSRWLGRPGEDEDGQLGGRVEEDFPTLAAATASASSRNLAPGAGGPLAKDPATTRWAGAVKNGRPVSQLPVNSRPSLPRLASGSRISGRGGERSAPFSQPRQSARLALRPPTLLPTISTGATVSRMYETYRQQFFEYGNARNKCLVKAAACFRTGDGCVRLLKRAGEHRTDIPMFPLIVLVQSAGLGKHKIGTVRLQLKVSLLLKR